MRLWGKIAKIGLLVIGGVFAIMAVFMPEQRWEALLAVGLVVALSLFGVPALVRLFSLFTGDEEVLSTGIPGSAAVTSIAPTWLTFNDCPVVRFGLTVEASGASYPIDLKQAVDPEVLDRLAPGAIVSVRVDRQNHKKVVIDWGEAIRSGQEAAGSESAEQQATAPQSSAPEPARRSLVPFLRWGFLLFGLVFFRLGCEEGYYEKGGARIQGIVLQKTYSPGTHSTSGSRGTPSKHYVSYRFTTREGRTIEGRYDVLPSTWQDLKEGGPVTVEYLADSPDTNRIPDQRARSLIWTIMAFVFLAASAVLFIINWRRRRQSLAEP
jgi:hypothetical protein